MIAFEHSRWKSMRSTPHIPALLALLVLGCQTAPQPQPVPTPPLPQPATEPEVQTPAQPTACIPTWGGSSEELIAYSPWLPAEGGLGACWSDMDVDSPTWGVCAAIDLTSGAMSIPTQGPPPPGVSATFQRLEARRLEVCRPEKGCVTLALEGELGTVEMWPQHHADWHPERDRVAVLTDVHEGASRPGFLELWDLNPPKRLARVSVSDNPDDLCGSVRWLGDVAGLFMNVCAGPGGSARFVDGATGKPLSSLAPGDFNAYGTVPVHLSGDRWAFLEAFAAQIRVQNIRTGEGQTLDLTTLIPDYSGADNEIQNHLVGLGDDTLALLVGGAGPDAGQVLVLTAQGQWIRRLKMARCDTPWMGFDAALNAYAYPFPVARHRFEAQGKRLEMAYMDIAPVGRSNGEVVLLLHGKNFSGAYWAETIVALSEQGFRIIVPDQIGFGKSSKPIDIQYSFHALAAWTARLLDALDIDRASVVGHSMGGMVATRFALMYPKRTQALALINPIGLEDWKALGVPYNTVDAWAQTVRKATPDTIRTYMKESYFAGTWKPSHDGLVAIQAGWAVGPDAEHMARISALTYDMIFTQPVLYEFSHLRTPTLLIIGTRDRTALGKRAVSPEVRKTLGRYEQLGQKAAQTIPQARLVELDDVGHMPHVEAFEPTLKALGAFLKNPTASTPKAPRNKARKR
ncbi:MAG: alpha/beta hydrolase [Myxococcota bacterium]